MKKKIITIGSIVFIIIFYSLYGKISGSNITENNGKEIISLVEIKGFDSNIEVSGTTKIKNEQKLRFNTTGKITQVKFDVGDNVRLGETLAEIDMSEVYNEIERTKLNLNTSNVRLDNFLDNLNKTGIKKANLDLELIKSQISHKEAALVFLESKQENDLIEKELSLKEEKNNLKILGKETIKNISGLNLTEIDKEKILNDKELELSKESLDFQKFEKDFDNNLKKKINEYYNSLSENYYGLEIQINESEKNLKYINVILGIDGDKFDYYDFFSAKDSSNKNSAKQAYRKSTFNLDQLNISFKNIESNKDIKNIILTLELSKSFYESFYNLNNYMVKGFDNSIETDGFSYGDISGYSSQFSGLMSDSKNKLTSINATIDNLKTITGINKITADLNDELKNKRNNIDELKIDIQKINNNQNFIVDTSIFSIDIENIKLEKFKTKLKTQILEFENFKISQQEELKQENIGLNKLKLELIDIEKRKSDLENLNINGEYVGLKNDVKQNQVNLNEAHKKLENYMIQAPFNGIITKVDFKPGDRLNSDTEKYISIVDPDTIEVKTFVNQSDIVKIKKGAGAQLLLGAYPDISFTGSVNEIETTPIEENGISKFELKILLENPDKLKLYSGMKAIVTIKYDTVPESLVVPFTAVNTDDQGKQFVTLIKDGKKEKRILETGFTDGRYYQVLSGLEEGDEILEIDYNSDLFKGDMFDGGDDEEGEFIDV